jgi:hypothetical protein
MPALPCTRPHVLADAAHSAGQNRSGRADSSPKEELLHMHATTNHGAVQPFCYLRQQRHSQHHVNLCKHFVSTE